MFKKDRTLIISTLLFTIVFILFPQKSLAYFNIKGYEIPTSISEIKESFSSGIKKVDLKTTPVVDKPVETISITDTKPKEILNDVAGIKDVKATIVKKGMSVSNNLKSDFTITEEDGLTKVSIKEDVLNEKLKLYTPVLKEGSYEVKNFNLKLKKDNILVNMLFTSGMKLNATININETGDDFSVSNIENPTGELNPFSLFIINQLSKSVSMDKIRSFVDDESGKIVKIKSNEGSLDVWIKY